MKVPETLAKFVGDLYIHKYPLWLIYKPTIHKVKGFEVRQITNALKKGDILIRKMDGYLSSYFIPGFWTHAGLYVGDNEVIHIVGTGCKREDVLDFCRTDSIGILRPVATQEEINSAVEKAFEIKKKNEDGKINYDYDFTPDDEDLYCTELVNYCYSGKFDGDYVTSAGLNILSPERLTTSKKVNLIIAFRH